MPTRTQNTRRRIQDLGEAAKGSAGRIRKVKLPPTGMAIGVALLAAIIGAYLVWRAPPAVDRGEAELRIFRIVTGSTAGTYFPIGETIAGVISEPPGAEPCEPNDRCGVRGLLAVVKSSAGSTANVRSLINGKSEAAFVQADIAEWAQGGLAMFSDEPLEQIRAIAALYPEAVQLVAAKSAGIKSVADLRGKRVSIDQAGSGTQGDALLILKAFGLGRDDIIASETEVSRSADQLIDGRLDAFFLISGTPATVVTDLADRGLIDLVPITGPPVEELTQGNRFFVTDVIEADTYAETGEVATISVKALFVTTAAADATLIHDLTAALWRPGNRAHLDRGHAKGKLIRLETALDGVSIPLHPGAARYYRRAGHLP